MSGKDYTKQVAKRQRIKGTTLVVGLDIGSEFNAMGMMNKTGELIGKYPKIYNSRKGFEYFTQVVEQTKKRNGMKKVLIGMEPTGHYWRKIAFYAKEQGYEVKFIRTTALKHQREVDESSSAKTDIKDAITIANIVREGKYIDTVIEDGVLRQLRTLAKVREKIRRASTSAQHRLGAVIDDYFPELKDVFWSMKAKGLWSILEKYPYPRDIIKSSIEDIAEIIAKSSRRKKQAMEKAKKIYKLAQESIGLKYIGVGDEYRLKICLEEVKHTEVKIKEVEKEMEKLLREIPSAEVIQSIPGVGMLTTAVFLGELGDPKYFNGAKQIIKYAGYDPKESDSGKNIGGKIISKKGRWLLRKYLYFMGMRVINHNDFFKEYYERKLAKRNKFGRELKKKEAICAVVIKLIKVIFALLRDNRKFTAGQPDFA
jgi:transposase